MVSLFPCGQGKGDLESQQMDVDSGNEAAVPLTNLTGKACTPRAISSQGQRSAQS